MCQHLHSDIGGFGGRPAGCIPNHFLCQGCPHLYTPPRPPCARFPLETYELDAYPGNNPLENWTPPGMTINYMSMMG